MSRPAAAVHRVIKAYDVRGLVGDEIDDEDEFEAHTRDFAYPARLVTAAREAADAVRSMIENGEAPFDGSHRAWLAKI